jgi:DNA-binding transcriptional LysR family regulator
MVSAIPWRNEPYAGRKNGPLILNDDGTSLSRLTGEWFAQAGEHPQARIQLNYNDAIKSLVAAGYGAALLPHEGAATAAPLDPLVRMLPLQPRLWRHLGIAHRSGAIERATQHVLDVLWQQQLGAGRGAGRDVVPAGAVGGAA